jgi:potassium efflux system protein
LRNDENLPMLDVWLPSYQPGSGKSGPTTVQEGCVMTIPATRCCQLGLTWLTWILLVVFTVIPIHASADTDDAQTEESQPEEARRAVQPELQADTDGPPQIQLPDAETADIRQQIKAVRESLDQRRFAVESTRNRLAYAESLLNRLRDEYNSFELRLEKAGLNLTGEYASLLRQRLERLERQGIADELINEIEKRLSTAREEQLRLEEFEAVIDPGDDARDQLRSQRASLVRQLHKAVTEHIQALNEYYNTVSSLKDRIETYQTLLQQRLFWLPSAAPVGIDTLTDLLDAGGWFASQWRMEPLTAAIGQSVEERGGRLALLVALFLLLMAKRRTVIANLEKNNRYVGNVGQDRIDLTLYAFANSLLLALPGVIILSVMALLLMEGNEFFSALSEGFRAAALVTLLLVFIQNVARRGGLGEAHFKWHVDSLGAIRRELPILLAVLIPITVIMRTTSTPGGSEFQDSLGRLLFMAVSVALSVFAQRIMSAVRADRPRHRLLRFMHVVAVGTPLVLVLASLIGYHYTALELERNLFVSVCWIAFNAMLFYVGLRALSVRERRLTLKRLRDQREAERKAAENREAGESSGDAVPPNLDMPEMNLKDINQQSTSLLRILMAAIIFTGLWMLWANLIPALHLFDDITLWTIATDLEGGDPLPITLGDLMLALLVGIGTVMAVRNLPGTLEVMVLSRMKLEPGTGYAITTLTTYTLVFVGIVAVLGVIGVQWSKLQWLVAALGVGLGFGLQEIVANFVSGIILLFERPIRVGDTVTIGGVTGTVSRIRIRATTLVDWDRKEQIIPNKTFVTQDLTNWTLTDSITRVILNVGVAYGSDLEQVQSILTRVAENNERVVDDPAPAVFCVGLGESRIDFELRVFVKDPLDIMPLSHEIHSAVTHALADAGIRIPFPQQDIHVRTMANQTAGNKD